MLLFLAVAGGAARARHRPRKSPHEEIVAAARVASAPERKRHSNGRQFEEFDVVLLSARGAAGDGRPADVNRTGFVHVVHDLTCGGSWLGLSAGDTIELKGEYVRPPGGHDLIHFTHPSDGSCGSGRPHTGGWIRRTTAPPGPGR